MLVLVLKMLNSALPVCFGHRAVIQRQREEIPNPDDWHSYWFARSLQDPHRIPIVTHEWELKLDASSVAVSFAETDPSVVLLASREHTLDVLIDLRGCASSGREKAPDLLSLEHDNASLCDLILKRWFKAIAILTVPADLTLNFRDDSSSHPVRFLGVHEETSLPRDEDLDEGVGIAE